MDRIFSQSDAETIALQALAFIASDTSLLEIFTVATGISLEDLHARAGEKDVLAGALHWLMQNECALLMFCANNAHPSDIMPHVAHILENGAEQFAR